MFVACGDDEIFPKLRHGASDKVLVHSETSIAHATDFSLADRSPADRWDRRALQSYHIRPLDKAVYKSPQIK